MDGEVLSLVVDRRVELDKSRRDEGVGWKDRSLLRLSLLVLVGSF